MWVGALPQQTQKCQALEVRLQAAEQRADEAVAREQSLRTVRTLTPIGSVCRMLLYFWYSDMPEGPQQHEKLQRETADRTEAVKEAQLETQMAFQREVLI